jgi:NADH:ubiquinone reductase (non-electrogenic)
MLIHFHLCVNKIKLCSAARKLVYCLRMPTDEHRVKVGISWFTKTAIDSLASVQNAVSNMLTNS